jgi:hypothetical protein
MKNLTGAELRTAFLQFFAEQELSIQPSSSLVLGNVPTLLSAYIIFPDYPQLSAILRHSCRNDEFFNILIFLVSFYFG